MPEPDAQATTVMLGKSRRSLVRGSEEVSKVSIPSASDGSLAQEVQTMREELAQVKKELAETKEAVAKLTELFALREQYF